MKDGREDKSKKKFETGNISYSKLKQPKNDSKGSNASKKRTPTEKSC
jgi:hypothetical protein